MGYICNEKLFLLLLSIWFVFSLGGATAESVTVDCNGNGNYISIQEAIDGASPGDYIIVLPGTYTENLLVNKPLSIVSESGNPSDTTILSANKGDDVIHVTADNVTISGFNITRADQSCIEKEYPKYYYSGIFLDNVENNLILKNNLCYNYKGIRLYCAPNNMVTTNNMIFNNEAIYLFCSDKNILANNSAFSGILGFHILESKDNALISNSVESCNYAGIYLSSSFNTIVEENNVKYCDNGIWIGSLNENSTFTDNSVMSNNYGFYLHYSNHVTISDNIISNNSLSGLFIRNSLYNTITENVVSNNSQYGIHIKYSSQGNLIYNNFFNNTHNVRDECLNTWNTTRTTGTNIVGGPYLGGNFWACPDGTGFSQTHEDIDKDGICDEIYAIGESNADKLPLSSFQRESIIVDWSGCGDYTSIQAAMDAATEGATIVVRNGTYTENINVSKSVTIISESLNPKDVIIRPFDVGSNLITISADNVTLGGLTVTGANSSKAIFLYESNGCFIANNIVESNKYGIYLNTSDNNFIVNNILESNTYMGLCLFESDNNTVFSTLSSNDFIGFDLVRACDNILLENILTDDDVYGIYFHDSSNGNFIINNTINGTFYFKPLGSSILNSINANPHILETSEEAELYTIEHISENSITDIHVADHDDISVLSNDPGVYGGTGLFLNNQNTNNTITKNRVENNFVHGMYIGNGSSGNIIYDNHFNNTDNFYQLYNNINNWNVTRIAGESILGGPYIGGNYWANPSGTGFSQISPDMDQDGICDEAYILNSNNTDYFPLFNPITYASIVSISPNPAYYGDQVMFNGTGKSFTRKVINYTWYSNIDGQLNNNSTFKTSNLSIGNHTIYFSAGDNCGDWSDEVTVNLTIKPVSQTATTPSTSTTSSGGSGGGGGGGTTGETYENIAFKDVRTEFVEKDSVTSYDFENDDNEVEYIQFIASRNWGQISATIECLHDTSALVDRGPDGIVYRNLNIWVGKSGFSDPDNIRDCVIGFKVSRSWLLKNGVDESTVRLMHYSGREWEELETGLVDEDDEYLHFEARTPGFSQFAIVGYPKEKVTGDGGTKMALDSANEQEVSSKDNTTESQSTRIPAFGSITCVLSFFIVGFSMVLRKGR